MASKYVVYYDRGDCSGGVLYVRSGVNATSEAPRACGSDASSITTIPVNPKSYLPEELYMDLTWDDIGVTERIIQHACVYTGSEHRFAWVDCDSRSYNFFEDADCKEDLGTSVEASSVKCVMPNAFGQANDANTNKTSVRTKYLKKYEHEDCTGAILFVDDLVGAMAAAQEVEPCKNGFEVSETPPRPDQYRPGQTYMSVTNPYLLFSGTVLDRTCVSYAPDKYVKVNCSARTSVFYTDPTCTTGDQEVLYPSKVWGVHCSVFNSDGTSVGWWRGYSGVLVGLVLISIAAVGIISVLWKRNRKSSRVDLPLKGASQPSYFTDGRNISI
ncbi:unnamed protein product [Aphanomyces euteiches]|uniref:Uncharacterized protein n=1 Tax=Aphanomyces euteiches TaxID=100861 RepID=A0A6G0X0W4_9STRA|nr:hypothetical protein Ae201684_009687 [Aphanomyces euteiches]KAH9085582.1 hypothetical protein Ae201684P_005288 [Aphanomyces euteiches]KAH9154121.1 hypothetical protein AeRB84_003735 [Aphanomyces euteiches]